MGEDDVNHMHIIGSNRVNAMTQGWEAMKGSLRAFQQDREGKRCFPGREQHGQRPGVGKAGGDWRMWPGSAGGGRKLAHCSWMNHSSQNTAEGTGHEDGEQWGPTAAAGRNGVQGMGVRPERQGEEI